MRAAVIACGLLSTAAALDFESVPVPSGDDMHRVTSSSSASFKGKQYNTTYHVLTRTGDMLPIKDSEDKMWPFGLVVDQDGQPVPLVNEDGTRATGLDISNQPDYISYLTPEGSKYIYQLTHFESPRPGSMYLTTLEQDLETCKLTAVNIAPVDFSSVGGIWIPCAGSVTPWGTHLGSEEYEPDARAYEEAETVEDVSSDITGFMRYFNKFPADLTSKEVISEDFKPYKYGYLVEIGVDADGNTSVGKHAAIGRLAYELGVVMPDRKTVYTGDDGQRVMMSAFVADKEDDLTAGTLYAAKVTQTRATGGGAFNFEWISLGHATQQEILAAAETTVFSDLFETEDPVDGKSCPTSGFTLINQGEYGVECLKLKEGKEKIASRLETRRYSALLGATTEFNKYEGITVDKDTMTLRWAISTLNRGMEDFKEDGEASTEFDIPTANHIRLEANTCGCVYVGNLVVKDGWMQVTDAYAQHCGVPDTDPEAVNACITSNIGNPDNLANADDKLIVAEDGSTHINNMMWALPLNKIDETKDMKLQRVLTSPYGAEITGASFFEDINQCTYLTASIQHPYDNYEDTKLKELAATGAAGYVGYFPFKL